ncbi:Small GTP-binding protein domain [Trinorchestia longiramus]|nr:Small GTP-binding protein domain [Trinorchestia longiramus]
MERLAKAVLNGNDDQLEEKMTEQTTADCAISTGNETVNVSVSNSKAYDWTEVDCISHCSSDWSDKKSSSDSLDWNSRRNVEEEKKEESGLEGQKRWHNKYKLSNDSGVAISSVSSICKKSGGSPNGSVDNICGNNGIATSHSNNSLNESWDKSSDCLSGNRSSESISMFGNNVDNSVESSSSLMNSIDSFGVNKSFDSLSLNDHSQNVGGQLSNSSCKNSSAVFKKHTETKLKKSDKSSKGVNFYKKLKAKCRPDSKLREWKSRTNVSCDIEWSEFNRTDDPPRSDCVYLNSSCEVLDRLSLQKDCTCYMSYCDCDNASRSSDNINPSNTDKFHPKNKVKISCKCDVACLDSHNGANHKSEKAQCSDDLVRSLDSCESYCRSGSCGSQTPITPKSSRHSLFSNSTPNSLSMTPKSLSSTSDSLLDTPDGVSNSLNSSSFLSFSNTPTTMPTYFQQNGSTQIHPQNLCVTSKSSLNPVLTSSNSFIYSAPPSDTLSNPAPCTSMQHGTTSNTTSLQNCNSNGTDSFSEPHNSLTNPSNSINNLMSSLSHPPPMFCQTGLCYTQPESYFDSQNADCTSIQVTHGNSRFYSLSTDPFSAPSGSCDPFSSVRDIPPDDEDASGDVDGSLESSPGSSTNNTNSKSYDYLLKFLLVGDSDVGKHEILAGLEDGASESPYCVGSGHKTTVILLDGKRVKLQLWDTSGQGRFCTIIRSYSRGAQGILLVYDITNKWSFEGLDRWMQEIQEHAPGVPKVLIGNRLHLAFKRQVGQMQAEQYAAKNRMGLFEVSPLCDFNIVESFTELSRLALKRNGMERLWRASKVLTLQELCCRTIVAATSVYGIERLPLPPGLRSTLKSYTIQNHATRLRQGIPVTDKHKKKHLTLPGDCGNNSSGTSCVNTSTCVLQ